MVFLTVWWRELCWRRKAIRNARSAGAMVVGVANERPAALGWYRPKRLEDGGRARQAGVGGG